MTATVPPHLQKYSDAFREQLAEVDELAQVILKGHLLIENALENIIGLIFFHPDHVFDAGVRFHQKVQIARAYALRKNTNPIWSVIEAINTARNAIAHNLTGPKRDKAVARLRSIFIREASPELTKQHTDAPDKVVAFFLCAMCLGFLGTLEEDTRHLRRIVDALDAELNPDQVRVAVSES